MQAAVSSTEDFSDIPRVVRGSWLFEHAEKGQTVASFLKRTVFAVKPHAYFTTIALVPVGEVEGVDLGALATYCSAFFGMKVIVADTVPLVDVGSRKRTGMEGQPQLCAPVVLDHLTTLKLPREVVCRVAVTSTDLFPRDSWNYVFGLARALDGVGVFSFCRYLDDGCSASSLSPGDRAGFALRCAKVLTHEVGHLFGLKHCVYHSCLMLGSNSLEEADAKPPHLCPVCLAKLFHAVKFECVWGEVGGRVRCHWPRFELTTLASPATRYSEMAAAMAALSPAACTWFEARAKKLGGVEKYEPARSAVAAAGAGDAPAGRRPRRRLPLRAPRKRVAAK